MKIKKILRYVFLLIVSLNICGCKNKEYACNHIYDEGIIKKEATCVSEGEKVYICTLCNMAKYETIPTVDHDYVEKIEKKPTETEEGKKIIECQVCKHTYTESIPVIVVEHKLGDKEMPYSFDDTIHIEPVTDLYGIYNGGATIEFLSYNPEDYSFEINIKLDDTGEQGCIEPFGGYAIVIKYVNENYKDISFSTDTTDANYKDLLYARHISLYPGGEGNTYIFSYDDIEELGEIPKYITIISFDKEFIEKWVWVELP